MIRKAVLLSIGVILLAVGAWLPASDAPGIGWGFEVEGLLAIAAGLLGFRWPVIPREDLLEMPTPEAEDVRHPLLWLSAVTALAALLRFYRLGSDLWLDEITTVLDYRDVSAWNVLTHYTSSNNHLLNTLAIKAMLAVFGSAEWAVRLPAVVMGIAGIPAVYALSRVAMRQREALFVALLLAVSYHHVFFSQNARGYSGLLFWSMLGTTFFLRGLAGDRARDWALYIVSMFLAVATVLYGVFVIAGHVLSFCVGIAMWRRRHKNFWPLARKLLVVWGILGLLSLHLYASVLSQVNAYAETIYRTKAVGYAFFSLEHFRELSRGLSAGFGGVASWGVIAVLLAVGLGFIVLLRRQMFFAVVLVAPLLVTGVFLLARGLRFSPRFFLWVLPVAWIFAVAATTSMGTWLRSPTSAASPFVQRIARSVPALAVATMAALSVSSLPMYYRVPKQPNRASLDWVLANRQADDPIVAAYLAKWCLRFYGPARGLAEGSSFTSVHRSEELQRVESVSAGRTVWLLTTFPRALRLEYPDLDRYIRERYDERKSFAATIGDGEVTVFTRRLAP